MMIWLFCYYKNIKIIMITIGDKIFKNFIELKSELERFNNLYRIGLPEISDKEFNIKNTLN